RLGVELGPDRLTASERTAESIEWRRGTLERLLEGRKRLGDIDQHRVIIGRGRGRAEALAIAARQLLVLSHDLRDVARGGSEFPRIEDRADALRPEAVRAARSE